MADQRPAPVSLSTEVLESSGAGPKGAWDVVGLTLGMPFADAEAALRERLPSGEVLTADRVEQMTAVTGMPEPSSSGKLFVSEDASELIAIFNEPPAEPDRVVALWRMLRLPAGTIDVVTLISQLEEKYGAPVDVKTNNDDRATFIWSDFKPESSCLDVSMTHQSNIWTFGNESSEREAFIEKRYFPGPVSYPLSVLAEYVAKMDEAAVSRMEADLRGACGAGLTVEMRTRPTAKPEDVGIEIMIVLQDPKTYGLVYLESLRSEMKTTVPSTQREESKKIDL